MENVTRPPTSLATLPLIQQALVVCLFAVRLLPLDLIVLPLKVTGLPLSSHSLFHKSFRPILLVDPRAIPFCRAFKDCSYLREGRNLGLARRLLVMAVWIENGSHFDQLQVALQLWSQHCLWQVKPLGSRSRFTTLP